MLYAYELKIFKLYSGSHILYYDNDEYKVCDHNVWLAYAQYTMHVLSYSLRLCLDN